MQRRKKQEEMTCDNIIIDGVLYNYQYSRDNLHIENSHTVKKRHFASTLSWIKEKHPTLKVWKRSMKSLKREWATHNFLYNIHFKRDQTADVDLDYPCDKPEWVYNLLGVLVWIFIA